MAAAPLAEFGPYKPPTPAALAELWAAQFAPRWLVREKRIVVDHVGGRVLELVVVASLTRPTERALVWLDVTDLPIPGESAPYRTLLAPLQRLAPAGQAAAGDHTFSVGATVATVALFAWLLYLARPESPAERATRLREFDRRYPL